MAETTLLRTSAIVRNATFAPPQHGPVKTGALPLVQVRMTPGGPQVQNKQKEVEILPPRDAKSALAIGGLPMVQVKMTQNGPQTDDGRDQTVVIKGARHAGVTTGELPMLQVKMTQAGPQVQTLSTVQGGPPQIPAATPALSAPRGPRFAAARQVAAPTRQISLPPVPELPIDQLMLCRHLVEKYLAEQHQTATAETVTAETVTAETNTAETSTTEAVVTVRTENVRLAELTIATLDEALVATAVRAEAATKAAAEAAEAEAEAEALLVEAVVTPSTPGTLAYAAASIAPAPSASYVAGRVGARPQGFVGARAPRSSALAPRRVARSGEPLPPVIVKMDGRRAVVVNQAEVAQVRAAVLNQASGPEALSESPEGAA
jgi:hypothetical protein